MSLADTLLPEFDAEMDNTRRVLERVPRDRWEWKPHPKSGTMGWLATHLAVLPIWAVNAVEKDTLDIAPGGAKPQLIRALSSPGEALETFDRNRAQARAAIATADDEHLRKPWSLLSSGRTIFSMPRLAVLRSTVMNHLIHHRGQLTVYLRMTDVPVPALYGPSADEGSM